MKLEGKVKAGALRMLHKYRRLVWHVKAGGHSQSEEASPASKHFFEADATARQKGDTDKEVKTEGTDSFSLYHLHLMPICRHSSNPFLNTPNNCLPRRYSCRAKGTRF